MTSKSWIERDAAVVWHGFTQMEAFAADKPLMIEAAEGHELIDVDGRRYLDAISSLWVNTMGHRVAELDQALRAQVDKVAHSTMLGHGNRVLVELAEALARVVPVDHPHFLFASDGAAAVEQGLKIAFQYWVNRGNPGKDHYLAFGDAYHGDTIGAMSVGGDGFSATLFDPLRFPVVRAPSFDDPNCIEQAVTLIRQRHDDLAAVVVEPLVQGAAGMKIAPAPSFRLLQDVCRKHDVLLVCDEVATGFGRTGYLFASEACELMPDVMCLGKGLTGGYLPMSATVAADHVYREFLGEDFGPRTLYHGHSYGGNALAAAVALRHLELVTRPEVLENVNARSQQLRDALQKEVVPLPGVADVRVQGLMCGVELNGVADERRGRRVCAAAVRRGVLLRPLGDVVVIMPPLTISAEEISLIVTVLRDAVGEVCG